MQMRARREDAAALTGQTGGVVNSREGRSLGRGEADRRSQGERGRGGVKKLRINPEFHPRDNIESRCFDWWKRNLDGRGATTSPGGFKDFFPPFVQGEAGEAAQCWEALAK